MQRSNYAVQKFYNSKQWDKTRTAYKLYRYGLCERCGKPGYIVHHKCYINMSNIYDTNVTLNFENLELLCLDCHNKEHFAKRKFDDNGAPKDDNKSILELAGVFRK